jgi:hypothetical protein
MLLIFIIYYLVNKAKQQIYSIIIKEFVKKIKYYDYWHENQYKDYIMLLEWVLL